jgi:hypothetical protein
MVERTEGNDLVGTHCVASTILAAQQRGPTNDHRNEA